MYSTWDRFVLERLRDPKLNWLKLNRLIGTDERFYPTNNAAHDLVHTWYTTRGVIAFLSGCETPKLNLTEAKK